jgi:hypothetical protein
MLINYNMDIEKILNNKIDTYINVMQIELDKLNYIILELQIEQLQIKEDIIDIKRILKILIDKYKLYSIVYDWK